MSERVFGFEPFFTPKSCLLILGSFPSVKSRQQNFYYGNRQNSFWRILSDYFGQAMPDTVPDKKAFLSAYDIALWDIVTSCEIVGSADSTIRNYKIADLNIILSTCPIRKIILNGGTAYNIFLRHYRDITVPYIKLPSTSPANARPKEKEWFDELCATFGTP